MSWVGGTEPPVLTSADYMEPPLICRCDDAESLHESEEP